MSGRVWRHFWPTVTAGVLLGLAAGSPPASAGVQVQDESASERLATGVGPRTGEARDALEAVAVLPADSRKLLLEAALYPSLLDAVEAVLAETHQEFQHLASILPPAERAAVWELVRQPGLADVLRSGSAGGSAGAALEQALRREGVSDGLLQPLLDFSADHPVMLRALAARRAGTEARIESLLARQPLAAQATVRALLRRQHLWSLVATHRGLVESLAALYRADPVATEDRLAALHDELTRIHSEQLPGWETADGAALPASPAPVAYEVSATGSVASPAPTVIVLDASIPRAATGVASGHRGRLPSPSVSDTWRARAERLERAVRESRRHRARIPDVRHLRDARRAGAALSIGPLELRAVGPRRARGPHGALRNLGATGRGRGGRGHRR